MRSLDEEGLDEVESVLRLSIVASFLIFLFMTVRVSCFDDQR